MSIQLSYDSKDSIPEGLANYYKENDGKFTLQVEGVKTQEDVDRAMSAMEKQKELRIEAEKNLAKYKDVDLDKWEEVKDYDPDAEPVDVDGKNEEQIRKEYQDKFREWKEEEQNKHKKELQEAQSEATHATEKAKNTILENWQRKMLSEKFGFTDPRRLNALMLEIKHGSDPDLKEIREEFQSIKAEEDGDKFRIIGGKVGDEKGAQEVLENISSLEISKHYKPAPANSGGGASNNGTNGVASNNPFKADEKGEYNRTNASILIKNDPETAKTMAKQAGWKTEEITW